MGRRFRCGARRCAGKGIRMEKRPVEKIVRIVTLAPVMALLALSILLGAQPERFGGIGNYVMAVIFLTVLPLLAYPLQQILPGWKDKGGTDSANLPYGWRSSDMWRVFCALWRRQYQKACCSFTLPTCFPAA